MEGNKIIIKYVAVFMKGRTIYILFRNVKLRGNNMTFSGSSENSLSF